MAVYAIYHYDFSQTQETALKFEGSKETPLDKAQEVFESLLQGEKPFLIRNTRKDAIEEWLDNEVVKKHEKTTLMLVCNEKHKKYMEKKQENVFVYPPACFVIFDNRDDVANIAIERSPSFDNDPDKVCVLLQEAINNKLKDYRLEISIRPKLREAGVWEVVENQTKTYDDRITKVVFNFAVPDKVKGIDAPKDLRKNLQALSSLCKAFDAVKASYKVEADKNGTLKMDRTQKDMAQMVQLCATNAYDLSIHFRYYGVYRFGADERAFSSLNDAFVNEFINGVTTYDNQGNTTFNLCLWLNDVRRVIEGYKDGKPVSKKRKKRRKE